MTERFAADSAGPPDVIYIIRHGEKPADPAPAGTGQAPPGPIAPFGVDDQGNQDAHSLLPRGWQRSGALAALFDPATGTPQAGLRTPGALLSPSYGESANTAVRRTYQTIQGLRHPPGLAIARAFPRGQEPQLGACGGRGFPRGRPILREPRHIPAIA